jgi:hypothetical protein
MKIADRSAGLCGKNIEGYIEIYISCFLGVGAVFSRDLPRLANQEAAIRKLDFAILSWGIFQTGADAFRFSSNQPLAAKC